MSKKGVVSLFGKVAILIMVAILTMAAIRLIPMYLQYYSVLGIMEDINTEIVYNKLTKNQVQRLLKKRFEANYIPITHVNKEDIELLRSRRDMHVTKVIIDYEVRKPFFVHIDFVGRFHAESGIDN